MAGFGITPAQIAQIAAVWRQQGDALDGITLNIPPHGRSGSAVRAVRTFCLRATVVSGADAARLIALGEALDAFSARSQESDRSAAVGIAAASAGAVR